MKDLQTREVGSPFQRYDYLGRKELLHQGIPDYLLMIARIEPARVRRVPAAAISEEGVDEAGEFALVACPCGAKPIANETLQKCPGCERYYVAIARGSVYVAYGAMTPPVLT